MDPAKRRIRHTNKDECSVWERLKIFLSIAEAAARLESLELIVCPGDFCSTVAAPSGMSDIIMECGTSTRNCEDILLRMLRAACLGKVSVKLCSSLPAPYKVMRESFFLDSKVVQALFPRLHDLGLLRD